MHASISLVVLTGTKIHLSFLNKVHAMISHRIAYIKALMESFDTEELGERPIVQLRVLTRGKARPASRLLRLVGLAEYPHSVWDCSGTGIITVHSIFMDKLFALTHQWQ